MRLDLADIKKVAQTFGAKVPTAMIDELQARRASVLILPSLLGGHSYTSGLFHGGTIHLSRDHLLSLKAGQRRGIGSAYNELFHAYYDLIVTSPGLRGNTAWMQGLINKAAAKYHEVLRDDFTESYGLPDLALGRSLPRKRQVEPPAALAVEMVEEAMSEMADAIADQLTLGSKKAPLMDNNFGTPSHNDGAQRWARQPYVRASRQLVPTYIRDLTWWIIQNGRTNPAPAGDEAAVIKKLSDNWSAFWQ